MPHKHFTATFNTDLDEGFNFTMPTDAEIRARAAELKAIKELPSELVGTVHDPTVCVDARPPTKAEQVVRTKAVIRAKRARPIQIASFEV